MNPSEFPILDLIPQRHPMQMIDKLLDTDERSARGSLFITESNLFCADGHFQESGLLEFIAQTAAAYTGFRNKINNGAVREGYIGAIKNLVIKALPLVNTEIQSEIVVENEIIGFTIIIGKVFYKDKVIVTCEMRILAH